MSFSEELLLSPLSNIIVHLSGNHQITEELKIEEKSIQTTITKMIARPYKNSKQQEL
ncbi:11286_t:CDS:2 [Funneliformis caledonium]|uniref:11286_t:CDS:1 n=1 Tax=Funneliformis caledonium TaxID=1117310 RepID=A0A9N8VS70_9GLOM|nr:11286_t:CDS:2 [Funneliformis caledonium]